MNAFAFSDEQKKLITNLESEGYMCDVDHSIAAAALVMAKGDDFYVIRAGEETLHNPTPLVAIQVSHES